MRTRRCISAFLGFGLLAACSSPSRPQAVAEVPFELSPPRDAGPSHAPEPEPVPFPRNRDTGAGTDCPRGKVTPYDFNMAPAPFEPAPRAKVPTLEQVSVTITNRAGVPRNLQILEVDLLGASIASERPPNPWEVARPLTVKPEVHHGIHYGPEAIKLVVPAFATMTLTVEVEPVALRLPLQGVRVHLQIDERRACLDQPIKTKK